MTISYAARDGDAYRAGLALATVPMTPWVTDVIWRTLDPSGVELSHPMSARPPRYDAGMRLTAWEEERLLIFTAAELARRHRDQGLLLNAPEAVALICDAMLEAARAGASYPEVEAAGRGAVHGDQVLPGVAALVGDVRLEMLMDDGVRLIVVREPLGPGRDDAPGEIRQAAPAEVVDQRERIEIAVRNTSRRVVRVTSHYPFERVNRRLEFDRATAAGCRLDIDAGSTERWAPGETRTVRLVRVR